MLTPDQYALLYRLRWTAFGVVGLAYMLSFFHRFATAAISTDLQQDFQTSAAALGSLAATYFYVYTVMQIPTGVLVDTLGPRKIVVTGGVIAAIGSILFGLAPDFSIATAGRLLIGLGVSTTFIAMLKLNAVWFPERRFATLAGLTLLMGNVGAVMAASPLAWLLGWFSWRTIFVMIGALSGLLALVAWFNVRNHPGEVGLPSMRELEGRVAHPPRQGHWLDGLREVLMNRDTWPGFFVSAGLGGAFFAFGGLWAVPYLMGTYGIDRSDATAHVSWLLIGFACGAFGIGVLSDRLGRRKPVLLAFALFSALCWAVLVVGVELSAPARYALFLFMGLGASGFTLIWACAKEVNRHALSGMATSVVNTGAFLGAAILQPLAGWVIDISSSGPQGAGALEYRFGIGVMFAFVLSGVISALWIKETYCRYQEKD